MFTNRKIYTLIKEKLYIKLEKNVLFVYSLLNFDAQRTVISDFLYINKNCRSVLYYLDVHIYINIGIIILIHAKGKFYCCT